MKPILKSIAFSFSACMISIVLVMFLMFERSVWFTPEFNALFWGFCVVSLFTLFPLIILVSSNLFRLDNRVSIKSLIDEGLIELDVCNVITLDTGGTVGTVYIRKNRTKWDIKRARMGGSLYFYYSDLTGRTKFKYDMLPQDVRERENLL